MRYPPGHKEETRRRILSEASALFRRQGVEATGLPEVMKAAGLTVGGFYRHFDSKSTLFREAVKASLQRTLGFLRHNPGRGRRWLAGAAARYLSRDHLANVAHGCPLATLTPDIARADDAARKVYGDALREMVDELEPRMPEDGELSPGERSRGELSRGELSQRDRAWAFIATNVGGLMLARGVDDPELAEEILAACRRAAAEV